MERVRHLIGIRKRSVRGGGRTALARGWPKEWVRDGEVGAREIMLFNARNGTFDSCTLTSGSELWLFLLSIDVTHSCLQSVSGDLGGCVCAST